ncbi:MAG: hypothetical protein COU35_00725 [Candidatus Magasanikbacteria bacterium CG10_big_fil_rev_8_21_14_0_10_47_10]|uniref:Mercury ion transport protein n=1 Tax=Candidatus Magasanikbacteria bacterium CG10_big_fil_rev_8_21_14_0_10_47_10 TaxID=1974652 RepID=A0A2H0TTC3_9BACT|nr:MAG: hypothetical protein COU35_00725 [Candidatus Magasanikbacteria bacterium CG10_big_fil_rev_8_21_14_0_10_47_10]
MLTKKDIFKITWFPVLIASLCCFAPVILVLFGLSTVAFAASLSDVLYGQYKWWFRLVGLILLTISFVIYLRRSKGICTIDQAKQRRNEIINLALIVLSVGVIGYILWLYVGVELIGLWLGIWG